VNKVADAPNIVRVKISPEQLERYKKAGYRVIGKYLHSGVEICRWTKAALKGERFCYKKWYGVASHRCVQMTPTLDFCNFSCIFCWRMFSPDRFKSAMEWDDPKTIVDAAVRAQRELLAGYKGHPKTTTERFLEAMHPVHFAISLDGEPTLYPHIVELINEVKKRGWTAFLVTNGTVPHRLKEMLRKNVVPTNLYISVYATNPEDYKRITNSFIPNPMDMVIKSLKLMPEFEKKRCRTVFRMTLVKGLNLKDPQGYSKLIKLANPMFVELKGYTWAGESTKRLPREAMPTLEELIEFAKAIEKETGYHIKEIDEKSRVVMLVRDEETWLKNLEWIKEQNKKIKEYDEKWKEKLKGKDLKHLLKHKLLE